MKSKMVSNHILYKKGEAMRNRKIKSMVSAAFVAVLSVEAANLTGTIPDSTGFRFTDSHDLTWDLDSLLNAGCVVVSHQSWAG